MNEIKTVANLTCVFCTYADIKCSPRQQEQI